MLSILSHHWWLIALRGGGGAILFGIVALLWPALTLLALLMLFGAFCLVDGVVAVIAGITAPGRKERWWGELLSGSAGILIGLITLLPPRSAASVLVYYIAAWAALTGICHLAVGMQLRSVMRSEWVKILSGLVGLIFSFWVIRFPEESALSLVLLFGAYSVIFGVFITILAFSLRSLQREE